MTEEETPLFYNMSSFIVRRLFNGDALESLSNEPTRRSGWCMLGERSTGEGRGVSDGLAATAAVGGQRRLWALLSATRVGLAGCVSDTENVIAAVAALSHHVVAQEMEVNSLPSTLAFASGMLAHSPRFCTAAAMQLTLQHCAVSSRLGVHREEEFVEGVSGHG
jgi:hypothetical protein